MSPLVAAIIMPVSSISVVAFTSLSTWLRAMKYFKKLIKTKKSYLEFL
jgi:Cu+-exporting ATPase